ncbi:hypothetical protein NKJ26_33065 [Mesorhizobium sp. M0152]|uniref:hypothetical protein n=1 Tax=Mesorhizobium sp. M0152 TaxID=2956898 RepID=UPI0033385429
MDVKAIVKIANHNRLPRMIFFTADTHFSDPRIRVASTRPTADDRDVKVMFALEGAKRDLRRTVEPQRG